MSHAMELSNWRRRRAIGGTPSDRVATGLVGCSRKDGSGKVELHLWRREMQVEWAGVSGRRSLSKLPPGTNDGRPSCSFSRL